MEVTSYGHIKPNETRCTNCGAWLKYTPADVKSDFSFDITTRLIRCPVCSKALTVGEDRRNE